MQTATMAAIVMTAHTPVRPAAEPAESAHVWQTLPTVAKPKQVKMQMQVGALSAIPQLEQRTDEQLMPESKHRVAAKAILGARAAERYDVKAARAYFNEALAGCHPQERPALRQMMKASLALAERRPTIFKAAMEKLGQEAPSSRQLLLLRLMGLVAPPASAGLVGPDPRDPAARPVVVICCSRSASGSSSSWPFRSAGSGPAAPSSSVAVVIVALGVLMLLGQAAPGEGARSRAAAAQP